MKAIIKTIIGIEKEIHEYAFTAQVTDEIATIARVAKKYGHIPPQAYDGWDFEYILEFLPENAPTDRPFTRAGRRAEKAAEAYYSTLKKNNVEIKHTCSIQNYARMFNALVDGGVAIEALLDTLKRLGFRYGSTNLQSIFCGYVQNHKGEYCPVYIWSGDSGELLYDII